MLLLHPNEPVAAQRLAIALFGDDAPAGAIKTVRVHVSRLRRALGDPDALVTTAAGSRLRVRPGELDAERFEQLVGDGRDALAAGDPSRARELLREGLGLWRGPALAELSGVPFAAAEIARLEEQRLAAVEARVEADLAAGRHAELVAELQRLVADEPLRERLHGLLMLALYRSGRQADALAAYRDLRRALVSEVGVKPAPDLRRLQEAILRQDAELELAPPPAELPRELEVATARPMVGRDRELAWLRDRWRESEHGDGMSVVINGPRGIGKTRLAAALAREVHGAGATVLYATGEELVRGTLDRAGGATRSTLLVVEESTAATGWSARSRTCRRSSADGRSWCWRRRCARACSPPSAPCLWRRWTPTRCARSPRSTGAGA